MTYLNICIFAYIYIYTYIFIYTYVYTHTRIHIYTHTCIHIYESCQYGYIIYIYLIYIYICIYLVNDVHIYYICICSDQSQSALNLRPPRPNVESLWGHVSGGSMTVTFCIQLPQLKSVLPQLKYKSLCD